MSDWIAEHSEAVAGRFERELRALVDVSSPSGDVAGAEAAIAVASSLAPTEATVERWPCSSAGHAADVVLRLRGGGSGRVVLVGHVDTVVAHDAHEPLRREGDRLVGSGAIDMKGGDVLALGVLRALSARPSDFAEAALLLVCDEEWRTTDLAHVARFAGWDACLTFEGGERAADGDDGVVVTRKAAGAIEVTAHGRSAHAGSKPDDGANALLALVEAARAMAALHDPAGPARRSVVPSVLHSGGPINVVPDSGRLVCDVRADGLDAVEEVAAVLPDAIGDVRLTARNLRRWPGMDARAAAAPMLARAATRLGRPIVPAGRGGASDASHFATSIPVTIDGLGPLGGQAHAPGEWVDTTTVRRRAEVALATVDAVLSG